MTPESLHELFVASAGVAGALIGLLFVAISVEHDRLTARDADQVQKIRASAALTAFTNSLTISLFALVPGHVLGWTAFFVSLLGLFFVAGSILSLRRDRGLHRATLRDAFFLVGLVVAFGWQLDYAVRLISRAGDAGAADGIAVIVIVCFLIGITRSWELIGGPSIGLGHEVTAIVRAQIHPETPSESGERADGPLEQDE